LACHSKRRVLKTLQDLRDWETWRSQQDIADFIAGSGYPCTVQTVKDMIRRGKLRFGYFNQLSPVDRRCRGQGSIPERTFARQRAADGADHHSECDNYVY
jgi:hypothetical protein